MMGTAKGALSNFSDGIFQVQAAIGKALLPGLKLAIPGLTMFANTIAAVSASPLGQFALVAGAGLTVLAGAAGVGILAFIGLSKAYSAGRAALLAFNETNVGCVAIVKAMIFWQNVQKLSVNGVVASLRAANVALLTHGAALSGAGIKATLASAATWLLARAQVGLAATAVTVGAAFRIMWAALLGPIGWIIGAVALVGAGISWLVGRHKAAAKAADEQAAALTGVGEKGTQAEEDAAEATDKAAEAAKNAAEATVALDDARRNSARLIAGEASARRDVEIETRNAGEALQDAAKGVADQEKSSADKIAEAQTTSNDARREASKVAVSSARDISDAARRVGDAETAAADRTSAAADTVTRAFEREKKAALDVEATRLRGAQSVEKAEASGEERKASARRRLDDALRKQAGIELTPEEQNDRDVADAQAELGKAEQEAAQGVTDAKAQAAADLLKAEEDLKVARDESRKAAVDLDKAIEEGKRQIADAERALGDARIAAADAQTAAAERVNAAEQALAVARTEQDAGRESALRRYRDAQEAYNKAIEAVPAKLEDITLQLQAAARALVAAEAANTKAQAEVVPAQPGDSTGSGTPQSAAPASVDAGTAMPADWGNLDASQRRFRSAQMAAAAKREHDTAGYDRWKTLQKQAEADIAGRRRSQAPYGAGQVRGGGRAGGGPVSPGVSYTVGETGREWFVPNVAGTIVPSPPGLAGGAGPGGKVVVQNFVFNGPLNGEQGIREFAQQEISKAGRAMAYAQ